MRANISPHCLFFESFWFSRRFLFLTKSGKNLEKTKKNKKQPKIRRLWGQTFPYFFFGRFLLLLVKNLKQPRENPKKRKIKNKRKTKKFNKKLKNLRLGDYMRLDISLKSLFFLFSSFFFCFLEVFLFLTKSSKNLEAPKKTKIRRPDISLKSLVCRERGREAGTRGLKAFGVFFGNLRRTPRFLLAIANYFFHGNI